MTLSTRGDLADLWPPESSRGRTVVTTRRRDAALDGNRRTSIEVDPFTPGGAEQYLAQRLRHDPELLEGAANLVEELGNLPLALAQAATFILDPGPNLRELRRAGHRPDDHARRARGRKTIMKVSAISRKGQLRFRLHSGSFDAAAFIDFCKRLMATTDKPVFLIVDNAHVHHAKIVKAFEAQTEGRLRLFYLPPYSPQLNSDELVWNTVKNGRIGKASIKNGHDMRRVALGALRSLHKLPETVKRLFNHPELVYILASQPE